MPAYLHALGTALPPHAYPQSTVRDLMRAQESLGRRGQRLVPAVFNASGIETRHSVIGDYQEGSGGGPFFEPETRTMLSPSTGFRNEVYTEQAPKLFLSAAQRALQGSSFEAKDITHVITVSCTGFFAPGPDYLLVRQLGLKPTTARYHVGFMGCYAAFPALKMAKAFCDAAHAQGQEAVVLVVSAELCSLHVSLSDDPDSIISSTVFADGAGAALVSHRPPAGGQRAFRMDAFETALTPVGEGEKDMAWTIGDEGYRMVLSSYVPDILETHLHSAVGPLLRGLSEELAAVGNAVPLWAVHPGGRSILDKVQGSLGLSDDQMHPSREVLRQYGNMSSATVLFILRDLLAAAQPQQRACALAFGPGLTVESGLFTCVEN